MKGAFFILLTLIQIIESVSSCNDAHVKKIRSFLENKNDQMPKLVYGSNHFKKIYFLQCKDENKVFKNQNKQENIFIYCNNDGIFFLNHRKTNDDNGNHFYDLTSVALENATPVMFECKGNPFICFIISKDKLLYQDKYCSIKDFNQKQVVIKGQYIPYIYSNGIYYHFYCFEEGMLSSEMVYISCEKNALKVFDITTKKTSAFNPELIPVYCVHKCKKLSNENSLIINKDNFDFGLNKFKNGTSFQKTCDGKNKVLKNENGIILNPPVTVWCKYGEWEAWEASNKVFKPYSPMSCQGLTFLLTFLKKTGPIKKMWKN